MIKEYNYYNNYKMCGIWSIIQKNDEMLDIKKYLGDFWNLKHRGPDNSHFETFNNVCVGFHRLSIVDTSFKSNQPYILNENGKTIVFICNGEIYNFQEIDHMYNLNVGTSDCLIIPKLYLKFGANFQNMFRDIIKGEFAFILFEFDNMKHLSHYIIGRDMIGVRPLYRSCVNSAIDYYSSEIKGMSSYEGNVEEFPPGNIITVVKTLFDYKSTMYNFATCYGIKNDNIEYENIQNAVINSIKRRLYADRPIAFLLSGGVDSSLIASISAKILGIPIRTFCCGIKGSTDMKYAKMVAEHIGSFHTEVYFTEEEGLDAIYDVIRTVETWDTTTIRASVGQYIVCRYIAMNTDCKVVMVGEGPDEVCSSYLFNYYAPSPEELHKTAEEYVKNIHIYDGKRADRCIARWGLEGRIALLDPEFISTYWSINPIYRMPTHFGIEKYLLRKAFDNTNLLPHEVLWRKKEAFSDGVSSKERSWYQMIQDHIKTKTNGTEMDYYKKVFIEHFGEKRINIISHYWQPKWDMNGVITKYVDPSARTLDVY